MSEISLSSNIVILLNTLIHSDSPVPAAAATHAEPQFGENCPNTCLRRSIPSVRGEPNGALEHVAHREFIAQCDPLEHALFPRVDDAARGLRLLDVHRD